MFCHCPMGGAGLTPVRAVAGLLLLVVFALPSAHAQVPPAQVRVIDAGRPGEPVWLETRGCSRSEVASGWVRVGGYPAPRTGVLDTAIVVIHPGEAESRTLELRVPGRPPARLELPPGPSTPPPPGWIRAGVLCPRASDPESAIVTVELPADYGRTPLHIYAMSASCALIRPISMDWSGEPSAREDRLVSMLRVTTSGGVPNRVEVRIRRTDTGPLSCFVRDPADPRRSFRLDRVEFALPEEEASRVPGQAPRGDAPGFREWAERLERSLFTTRIVVREPESGRDPDRIPSAAVEAAVGDPGWRTSILVSPDERESGENPGWRGFIALGSSLWMPDDSGGFDRAVLARIRCGIEIPDAWRVYVDFAHGSIGEERRISSSVPASGASGSTGAGGAGVGAGAGVVPVGGASGGFGRRPVGAGGGSPPPASGTAAISTPVAAPDRIKTESDEIWMGRIGLSRRLFRSGALELHAFAESGRVWVREGSLEGGILFDGGLELSTRLFSRWRIWLSGGAGWTRAGAGSSRVVETSAGVSWDF